VADPRADIDIGMRSFDRSLPMALMRAREASMRTFRPMLGEHGLTEQQWRVLRALGAGRAGLEVGELAEATFLLGPSLSRILANLEDRHLVDRSSVPRDARRSLISLTDQGLALARRVAPRSEQAYERIEEIFGADRLAELLDLLDDLALIPAILDEPEEVAT
jgi:homoprotocatechuate degradation regulator HpaR